jgi:hypothetical protein
MRSMVVFFFANLGSLTTDVHVHRSLPAPVPTIHVPSHAAASPQDAADAAEVQEGGAERIGGDARADGEEEEGVVRGPVYAGAIRDGPGDVDTGARDAEAVQSR